MKWKRGLISLRNKEEFDRFIYLFILILFLSKNILLVAGLDYSDQVYQALIDVKKLDYKLYLLTDWDFLPKEWIYEEVFIFDLKKTKKTLKFMGEQKISFDAVVIKTSEWLTPLTALLAKQYWCIWNDPGVAFVCRSKYHLKKKMQEAWMIVPKFKLCSNFKEIKNWIKEIWIPCILKPVGWNVRYWTFAIYKEEDLEDLKEKYEKSIKFLVEKSLSKDIFSFNYEELKLIWIEEYVDTTTDYLVEEFIHWHTHLSVDSITQNWKTTIFWIAHHVKMKAPYFIQLSKTRPYLCNEKLKEEIEDLVIKTINVVWIKNSNSHVEIILSDKWYRVIEVACRVGWNDTHDAVFQTTWYNLMYESIMIALWINREYKIKNKCHIAMQYFFPKKKGVIENFYIPGSVRHDPNITEIKFISHSWNSVDTPPDSFDFMWYLCAKWNTPVEAQENLSIASRDIIIDINTSYANSTSI